MFKDEKNSFNLVETLVLDFIPCNIALKYRKENNITIVMTSEYSIEFLNDVASTFFLCVDGKKKIFEIIEMLYQEYEIDKEILTSDIITLSRELQLKRIIKLV